MGKQDEGKLVVRPCLDLLETWRRSGYPVIATRTNAGLVELSGGRKMRLCDKGWPDITACIDGRFVGIECKTPSGRQSKPQGQMQKSIEDAGGAYIIVRSDRDLNRYLRSIFMKERE